MSDPENTKDQISVGKEQEFAEDQTSDELEKALVDHGQNECLDTYDESLAATKPTDEC